MKLEVYLETQTIPVEIDNQMLAEAKPIFAKMDSDMDEGMQMHQVWVDKLNTEQRCQLVADKIITAIEGGNENMLKMMSAYILHKVPGIKGVRIAYGEMGETELVFD